MVSSTNKIDRDFIVITPDKSVVVEHADGSLYERLGTNYGSFKGHELISCHEFSSDWSTWEIHPNGDEVVMLLEGEVTFVLQGDSGEESVTLRDPGSYAVVPRNTWHTARTSTKTKVLFITPGEGTLNKDA